MLSSCSPCPAGSGFVSEQWDWVLPSCPGAQNQYQTITLTSLFGSSTWTSSLSHTSAPQWSSYGKQKMRSLRTRTWSFSFPGETPGLLGLHWITPWGPSSIHSYYINELLSKPSIAQWQKLQFPVTQCQSFSVLQVTQNDTQLYTTSSEHFIFTQEIARTMQSFGGHFFVCLFPTLRLHNSTQTTAKRNQMFHTERGTESGLQPLEEWGPHEKWVYGSPCDKIWELQEAWKPFCHVCLLPLHIVAAKTCSPLAQMGNLHS